MAVCFRNFSYHFLGVFPASPPTFWRVCLARMLQEGFGPQEDLRLSAPEALEGWIHLAFRPCSSRAQLPTLLMEIGKFLVSEGILVFPSGDRCHAIGVASAFPQADTPS